MQTLNKSKSIIVACDCPPEKFKTLVELTMGTPGIGGYKLGMALGLRGLESAVSTINEVAKSRKCSPEIIFDYQKGGNDIPEMGKVFAREVRGAGGQHVILFPLAGPETQKQWTEACLEVEMVVSLGLAMTHPRFFVSEGGYISDEAPGAAFRLGCEMGLSNFIVPGNKVPWVKRLRGILINELGDGNYVLRAPGFIEQKGSISECGHAAGDY